MKRRRPVDRDPGNVVFGTIGWLFADLMFALAIAFLVATTIGQPPPTRHVTRTHTPTPSPSVTHEPVLELKPVSVTVNIDFNGLLNGDPAAKAALQRKVRSDPALKGRRAGLVLTFGGASGDGPGEAIAIAKQVDRDLQELGRHRFLFYGTVFRPFLSLGSPPSVVTIDIYLFKR